MTIVYKKVDIEKEKLREIILKNPGAIVPGLSFIDIQLGTEEEGIIDFLGVDPSGELVIVNFSAGECDDLLVSALSQVQWLKKNESLVKRIFFSENIEFSQAPQMIFVAPRFSDKFKSAVKQLVWHDLKLVEYKYIISQDKDAIFFEEIFYLRTGAKALKAETAAPGLKAPVLKMPPSEPPSVRKMVLPEKHMAADDALDEIALSPEEVAEFMDFDKDMRKE